METRKWLVVSALIVIGACHNRGSSADAGEASAFADDSAQAVALATEGLGSGAVQLDGIATSTFRGNASRFIAARFSSDTIYKLVVYASVSGSLVKAYEEVGKLGICGDPSPDLARVDRTSLASRELLVVEVRKHEPGCSGVGTTDIRTIHLLDINHAYREVFAYQADSLDYGNGAEVSQKGNPAYRHIYLFPNVCIPPKDCTIFTMVSMGSSRVPRDARYALKWNADSTALVAEQQ